MKIWTRLLHAIGLDRLCCSEEKMTACCQPKSTQSANGEKGLAEQSQSAAEAPSEQAAEVEKSGQP